MAFALTGAVVFDGSEFVDGAAIVVDGRTIASLCSEADLPPTIERRPVKGLIAPGFIDVQVNGGGGVLFNQTRTVDGIAAIGVTHRRFGTTGFLPTFITDEGYKMREALDAVRAGLLEGVPGLLGIHLEGPFINPARNGVHDADYIRPITSDDIDLVASPGIGRVVITLYSES